MGRPGPLEVSVAIRGSATLSAGNAATDLQTQREYLLEHLDVGDGGADQIVVEAGPCRSAPD